MAKQIIPRQVLNHGLPRWRVIVPKDLRKDGKAFHFYPDEVSAIAKAAQLTEDRDKIGAGFHALSQQNQALTLEALRRVNGDASRLLMAVERLNAAEKSISPKLIKTVVTECLASKKSAGMRPHSYKNIKSSLTKFETYATDNDVEMIGNVTTEFLEKWVNGQGWKSASRKTYIGHIGGLLFFAMKRGYIASNPALGVGRPRLDDKPPGIHTVPEVKAFLKALLKHDRGLIGFVAPIYFGGLRPAEAARLSKADVHDELIEVTPVKSKTRRRRFLTINETLRAWLDVKGVEIGPRNIKRRWLKIRKKLSKPKKPFPWPHDCLRHSFCSYSLPKYGAAVTAANAGHSEQILFAHYRERVKPDDVAAYWALRP